MVAMWRAAVGSLLIVLAGRALAQSGGEFELRPGSIVAGGGVSRADPLLLEGTLGQADTGQSRGGGFRLRGGLWSVVSEAPGASCVGDCGGDGQVTVDELVTMVGISIAGAPPARCENGDGNRDGKVSIDELIAAVNHALAACS